MIRLPTCLLLHETRSGSHHDWLLANPTTWHDPTSGLWTARVTPPIESWLTLGVITLEPLPPHRRHYLTYQGPLSDGRGIVRRIDAGSFIPHRWSDEAWAIDITTPRLTARVTARRIAPDRWLASLEPLPKIVPL